MKNKRLGIMALSNSWIVGKQSEYTIQEFLQEVNDSVGKGGYTEEDVFPYYMRYYPKGTSDIEDYEDYAGQGYYATTPYKNKGAFDIYAINLDKKKYREKD